MFGTEHIIGPSVNSGYTEEGNLVSTIGHLTILSKYQLQVPFNSPLSGRDKLFVVTE